MILAFALAIALTDSLPSPNALAARSIEGNTIVSPTNPPLKIRVGLPYVGRLTFRHFLSNVPWEARRDKKKGAAIARRALEIQAFSFQHQATRAPGTSTI